MHDLKKRIAKRDATCCWFDQKPDAGDQNRQALRVLFVTFVIW